MSLASAMKDISTLAKQARAIIEIEAALEQVGSIEGRQRAAEAAIAKLSKERDIILAEGADASDRRDAATKEAQKVVQVANDAASQITARAKADALKILADATESAKEKATLLMAKIDELTLAVTERQAQADALAKSIEDGEAKMEAIKAAIAKITG